MSAIAALGCALLVSCGGEPRLVPPDDVPPAHIDGTPVASPEAMAEVTLATPSIGEIVWVSSRDASTNAPTETVSTFPPETPRITASVLVNALPAASTIEATWAYNDTSLDAFTSQIVMPAPSDRTWISFHIDRDPDTPWPVGVYEVAIALDGNEVQRATVDVANQE